jgi:undecaprenyl-diphosphatase
VVSNIIVRHLIGGSQIDRSFDLKRVRRAVLPLLWSLLSAILSLVLFGWLAEEVFEGEFRHFDLHIRNFVHQFANPLLTKIMLGFTGLGSAAALAILFGIAIACFLIMKLRDPAVWLLIAMAGALILIVTLKLAFHRARPEPFFGPIPDGYSFPSGHALGSFVFYGVIAGVLSSRIGSQLTRILIWSTASMLITAIGLSRIYLGVHYPTDVIAGYTAGAVWVSTLIFVDRVGLQRLPHRTSGSSD